MAIPFRENPVGNDSLKIPLTFTALSSGQISIGLAMHFEGHTPILNYMYYKKNNSGWSPYYFKDKINVTSGDKVSFYHDENTFSDIYNYFKFYIDCDVKASGNIMSLLKYSKSCPDYCFACLFYATSSLKTAPLLLPAKQLGKHCYEEMFNCCYNLVTGPFIKATQFAEDSCKTMFGYGYELNSLKVNFTSWPEGGIEGFIYYSSTGILSVPANFPASEEKYGSNYIPNTWTYVRRSS